MIFLPLESLGKKFSKMEPTDMESVSFWKLSIVCNIKTEVSNFYPKNFLCWQKKSCLYLGQLLMGTYVHDTCVEKEENREFYFE